MSDISNQSIILYMHAGSKNHGCEAIAKSFADMIKDEAYGRKLITYRPLEDSAYGLDECYILQGERSFDKHKLMHAFLCTKRIITKNYESLIKYRYGDVFDHNKYPIAISIGGDNYCYDVMLNDLKLSNNAFNQSGIKTVLLGCSIEPELLKRADIVDDLNKYSLIIARESISYNALRDELSNPESIVCLPDPAFGLKIEYTSLPDVFNNKDGVVGINISPMIQSNETIPGITMSNYERLIEYILDNTSMDIALIPHVVWDNNDDRIPISELYEKYKNTKRIGKVDDNSASKLKYIISKCRFFIGARTHSTIAAYSTCVPTLVVGYSVKARGIACDLFGTDDNYVVPVQKLSQKDDLSDAFRNLMSNEDAIREHLAEIMPEYKQRAYQNGRKITELIENK